MADPFSSWDKLPASRARRFGSRLLGCVLLLLLGSSLRSADAQSVPVDFRREIQPLLAANCFACHGPDEEARQAGLRLDAVSEAGSSVIVAHRAADSELFRRIASDDPEQVMPPPDSQRKLTPEQKDLIRRWIDEGAVRRGHWAFEPIVAATPPPSDPAWGRGPVDQFVLAAMRAQALTPSQPADRRTLIRRVWLDLVGIGPDPSAVQAFVDDDQPEAWARVVDGLLASPHFGEQMAVEWLDAARYADTNGYQNDFYRELWPWRDWVMEAFNSGLPYNEFIKQQIAGDLLPSPTRSQLVATGFNRNNRTVTEGGSIEEEWRIENCIDRTDVTAGTFLGLTMGCARCHDHKYDPVSQREFYRFFAFFNNIDELGFYNEARGNVAPILKLPTPEQAAELKEIDARLAELIAKAEPAPGKVSATLDQWRREAEFSPQSLPEPAFVFVAPSGPLESAASPAGSATLFKASADAVPAVDGFDPGFERDQPFSWTAWLHGDARGAVFGKMDDAAAYRGVDAIILEDGRLKIHLIHEWPTRAIALHTALPLPPGEWSHVAVTWDGSGKAAGYRIYFDGQPAATETDVDALDGTIATPVSLRIGQRSNSEFFRGLQAGFRLFSSTLSPAEIDRLMKTAVLDRATQLVSGGSTEVEHESLRRFVGLLDLHPVRREMQELRELRNKRDAAIQTTMIMAERATYRPTFRLNRGQYDQPDQSEELWPAIPAALPQLTPEQPPNRLGLALWMVDDRNPLVARVAVNRAWIKLFGRGLVETPDNFGLQGTPPTHPELLDWLAHDFRTSGWNWKRLLRQILLSSTYQQASSTSAEALALDPANRWYARGPRYRLGAEQIRDNALSIAGLLVERLGGPSVRPYQPAGLWEELAGGANNGPYVTDAGENLYRRSLYTYRKRTVSHPTVSTFDAPSWEICQLQRGRTNTPLQALALLNDVTYQEAARKLAERVMLEAPEAAEARIRLAFLRATAREPNPTELATLAAGHRACLDWYTDHPDDARLLIATGASPASPLLDPVELAAFSNVTSVILNLDEVVTKE